jgi:hypothetical protein
VELRVSPATYAIVWGFVALLCGPFFFSWFSGQRGVLLVPAVLALVGVSITVLLLRVRLAITPEGVTYRTVARARHVSRAEIAAIHAAFGAEGVPAYLMFVETAPGSVARGLRINIKPFGRRDLRRFLETAEQLAIPIRLDRHVAREIGR